MIIGHTSLKVNYCDTDQMGYVHHSNYIRYYEKARMELLTAIGVPYKEIENAGFFLVVIKAESFYKKPAYFDDCLLVETRLENTTGLRQVFTYKIFNSSAELIHEGATTLAFVDKDSRKPCRPPHFFQQAVQEADAKTH